MPDPTALIGTHITGVQCCRCLGIDPPLQPGETVSWMQMNPNTGVGVNAAIYCFDPARDGEPFALSLGAYEETRVSGSAGQDYGTDRTVMAALDFVLDLPDGEDPPPLDDPLKARLKLVKAEWGAGLAQDDDRPLAERLIEVGRILANWPATRERGDD